MEWLKKIAGYAPDIVGAIVSGGATLPATALRIISKELTGVETDNIDLVEKAVNNATPDQLLKLRQANNDFIVRKIELQNEELANQRGDTQDARKVHKGHWMTWLLPLLMFLLFSAMAYGLIKYAIPVENKDILVFMAGQVSGFMAAGVTYWLGSSRGSAEKQMDIKGVK
jgi:hypothetical protein